MRDYLVIGSAPYGEKCAQVGASNYYELSRLELRMFIEAIVQVLGVAPEGAMLGIKDGEVVCHYIVGNEKAEAYAQRCETDAPQHWADVNMKAPRLDDPEFTEAELIQVPEKGVEFSGPPATCEMPGCSAVIKNEFFDGVTKPDSPAWGSWAAMCPACFCQHSAGGRDGCKSSVGQRYRKAVDGKFYKVE